MKLWMRKFLVALITVATLGMYTPAYLLDVEAEDKNDNFSESGDNNANAVVKVREAQEASLPIEENRFSETYLINDMTEKAKEQTMMKFGPRMQEQVEDEFDHFILPTIETVLESIIKQAGEDSKYLRMTETPAKGYGERIFHVYNEESKEDIARFHIRRDNRPQEGYYFNFHYHLSNDGFRTHHQIGEIYWDKNTPPKWMA
ncbi:hypothetical protein D8M04_14185 [Oceanobacillus piezotolerans]|uniref:Cell division protein FtsK n=1 Tax=Oceanobacillus piezotolerans TaxID=2448030 RepID=A0A498D5J4_9BACI|nr:YpjP family protein [Oceanobacillus piezotolerans]RLL42700.1 hypothetical protein D8M04_14185 [Oceanobacillus piezotolerans]